MRFILGSLRHMKTIDLLILLTSARATDGQSSMKEVSGGVPSDLASMLQTQPIRQQDLFSHALRIIHSMESSPTCNRLAALTLINSCQSLEQAPNDTKRNSELVIDEVKSEYAARLAICELIGAKANVPRDCSILVPSSHACGKFRLKFLFRRPDPHSDGEMCYPDASHSQFEQCLRALESKPQWWTSYSNARQNAVVMCQASRDVIERDEKLAMYKSLAEATFDISSALRKSIEDAQTRLAEQMAFIESIRATQAETMKDVKQSRDEAVYSLGYIVTDVRSAIQMVLNSMTQSLMSAESQVDELYSSIHKSKDGFSDTRSELEDLFTSIAASLSAHSVAQTNQLQVNHEGALALQQAIDVVRFNHMHSLTEVIGSLTDDVHLSKALMAEMYDRQNALDERLTDLGSAFGSLESSAVSLQTTINKSTEAIQMINIFAGYQTLSSVWVGVILLIVGLWFASHRLAGYVLAIIGLSWLASSYGLVEWLKNRELPSVSLPPLISHARSHSKLMWLSLIMVASYSVFIFWRWVQRHYICPLQDERGEKAFLPSVETPQQPDAPTQAHRPRFRLFSTFWPVSS